MSTEHNPFAALLDGVPRYSGYDIMWQQDGHTGQPTPDGKWVSYDEVLTALAAAVPADLAEAGKVLEALREDADFLTADAADLITALLARITAQEAQMKRGAMLLEATMTRAEAAETALAAMTKERDELRKRLEIDHFYVLRDGKLVREEGDPGADGIECRDATIALLDAALAASEARVAKLVEAGKALQADMLERARIGTDAIHGEEYRIVNAGRTAWADFCAAITEAGQ